MTVRRKIVICAHCGERQAMKDEPICWRCRAELEKELEQVELEKDAAWVREQRLKAKDDAKRVPDGWPPYAG